MRQVLRAGALGRPRGMGWGGRWEGGSGWETHVNPWLTHVNVWQKPLQYCKVIGLQLIKINEKKKKRKKGKKCSYFTEFLKLKSNGLKIDKKQCSSYGKRNQLFISTYLDFAFTLHLDFSEHVF